MIAARSEIPETDGVFDRACARPTPSKRLMHPVQIAPTAVGGLFIVSLHREADRLLPESHARQWVDCSGAAYTGRPIAASRIPPTAVGGLFRCSLQDERPTHLFLCLL